MLRRINLAMLCRSETIEEQLANDLRDQIRTMNCEVLAQEENTPSVEFSHRCNV